MKQIIRAAALADIELHWHYIAQGHLEAAARFRLVVQRTFDAIAAQPALLGHEMGFRRHAGVRSYRLPPPYEKYLVFFRLHARHVEFKRVLHGARHLPRLFRGR